MKRINFTLNGENVSLDIEDNVTLLKLLRETLNLTGTKEGCGQGDCGACTVLVNGKTVNSCIFLAVNVDGANVITIEGLAKNGQPDVIQQSFVDNGAVQCGFCIPGMVLSAKALLDVNDDPSDEEIKRSISGNLCRCTGYVRIVESIKTASRRIREKGRSKDAQ
ncbi:(2Fe-2S)-binding protein [Cloacibacillus evryensis]|uniref:(2Fe-2S)-binding protein n=1 Tax=Cloacibacillus evryensis TaxID=508460 RepID=UPI00241D8BEE|nr:(2Fe-2S)-binding protein [Cloacibacillus evryensis]